MEFGKQRIDFNVLLSEKELQKATAKVLEKVLHYQSGREWCAKIGVGKKLGEIVAKTCDTKDPEERKSIFICLAFLTRENTIDMDVLRLCPRAQSMIENRIP